MLTCEGCDNGAGIELWHRWQGCGKLSRILIFHFSTLFDITCLDLARRINLMSQLNSQQLATNFSCTSNKYRRSS